MPSVLRDAKMDATLRQCIDLCDRGFNEYRRDYYAAIDRMLSEVEQTVEIEGLRRSARGGEELVSPRFAYPHLKSAMKKLLGEEA